MSRSKKKMKKLDSLDKISVESNPKTSLSSYERLTIELNGKDIFSDSGKNIDIDYLLQDALADLAGLSVSSSKASAKDQLIEGLDDISSLKNKYRLAVCILRLLPHSELNWINKQPWRPRVISLFDDQFSNVFYREQNIDSSLQGHKKMEILADLVKSQEDKFRQAILLLTSLNQLNSHRQNLMKALNNNFGKYIQLPFLPDDITAQLQDLYKYVEKYNIKRDKLSVVDAYRDLNENAINLAKLLDRCDTYYSKLIAEGVARRIVKLVGEDFRQNKAVQPGNVHVYVPPKRYPLYEEGREISLRLSVENRGPGYAYDIQVQLVTDNKLTLKEEIVDIGRLPPETKHSVDFTVQILKASSSCYCIVVFDWKDFDNTLHSEDIEVSFKAQRSDINWDMASSTDPYSLEPVEKAKYLVGRKETIDRLRGSILAQNSSSWIIMGQKRVGKLTHPQ